MTFEQELAKCQANMLKYAHLIVNKRVYKGNDAIYCGRGSIWGNQYTHLDGTTAQYRVANREEAVVMHRRQFVQDIANGEIKIAALRALAGKKLSCYCAPHLCHCSTIAAAAAYYAGETI